MIFVDRQCACGHCESAASITRGISALLGGALYVQRKGLRRT